MAGTKELSPGHRTVTDTTTASVVLTTTKKSDALSWTPRIREGIARIVLMVIVFRISEGSCSKDPR
jgi:hypothetical protein